MLCLLFDRDYALCAVHRCMLCVACCLAVVACLLCFVCCFVFVVRWLVAVCCLLLFVFSSVVGRGGLRVVCCFAFGV